MNDPALESAVVEAERVLFAKREPFRAVREDILQLESYLCDRRAFLYARVVVNGSLAVVWGRLRDETSPRRQWRLWLEREHDYHISAIPLHEADATEARAAAACLPVLVERIASAIKDAFGGLP